MYNIIYFAHTKSVIDLSWLQIKDGSINQSMAVITVKELSLLDDELSKEKVLIAKFKNYSETTSDTKLKNQYDCIAQKHQKHYDALYSLLK